MPVQDQSADEMTRRILEQQSASEDTGDAAAMTERILEGLSGSNQRPAENIARDYLPQYGGDASRISMARADNDAERQMRLRREYPEAEYYPASVMTEGRPTWRRSPDDPVSFVSPTMAETLAEPMEESDGAMMIPNTVAAGTLELGNRAANILAPGAEQLAAESAALIATRGGSAVLSGVLKLLRYVGAGAVGGAGGEAVRQGVQSVQGVQAQDIGGQAQQVVGSGIAGGLGGAAGFGLESIIGRMVQTGPMGVSEQGMEAAEAMRELADLPGAPRTPAWLGASTERVGLMPQQVVRQGPAEIIKRISSVASRIWPRINNYAQRQNEVLVNALESISDPATAGTARQELMDATQELNQAFAGDLRASLGVTDIPVEEVGAAIRAGREVYEATSREAVDALYTAARAGGDFRFNVAAVNKAIDRIEQNQLRPLPGRDGSPVQVDPEGTAPLRRFIAAWREIDHAEMGVEDLLRLRGALHDMSQPGVEGVRLPAATANQLRAALGEAMDSPIAQIGADGVTYPVGPDALRAWRSAQEAAAQRFSNLDQSTIVEIARSDRPYQMAERFLQPGNVDQVRDLRRILDSSGEQGAAAWQEITNGFKADLLRDVMNLPERLAQYQGRNESTLGMMLTRNEMDAVNRTARSIERLRQTDIPQIAAAQESADAFIQGLLRGSIPSRRTAAIIDSLTDLANRRGVDSWAETSPGRAVRASAIESIINGVVDTNARGQAVNQARLTRAISNARARGVTDLLTDADMALLNNVELVNSIISQSTTDIGGAMSGTTSVSSIRGIGDALALLPTMWIGRILTSNAGRNLLIGSGVRVPQSTLRGINFMGRLADDVAFSQEESADLASFIEGGLIDVPEPSILSNPNALRAVP